MPTEWITTLEAANCSGYHVEAIRRLIRQGNIYAEKRARDWWVNKKSLEEYIRDSKVSKDKRRGPKNQK